MKKQQQKEKSITDFKFHLSLAYFQVLLQAQSPFQHALESLSSSPILYHCSTCASILFLFCQNSNWPDLLI